MYIQHGACSKRFQRLVVNRNAVAVTRRFSTAVNGKASLVYKPGSLQKARLVQGTTNWSAD